MRLLIASPGASFLGSNVTSIDRNHSKATGILSFFFPPEPVYERRVCWWTGFPSLVSRCVVWPNFQRRLLYKRNSSTVPTSRFFLIFCRLFFLKWILKRKVETKNPVWKMLLIENWFKETNATLEKKTKKLERREQHGGFQSHFFTRAQKAYSR